jgi:acetyl-CoA carboxylase biotin carboxyl carrier protein
LNFKEILELIDKVAERGIASVEVEQAGTRIRVEGKAAATQLVHVAPSAGAQQPSMQMHSLPMQAVPAAAPGATGSPAGAEGDEGEAGLHIITSPIVGTFYRAPNAEADVYVSVGDRITTGKVLCIVEAMKLMNEIEADVEGVITRIYPQNGQPIEYGEKLFAVRL